MVELEGRQVNRSRRRTTLLNMAFGCAQFALALVSGIILVPIYLKHITVSLYGSWLATGSIVVWLTVFDPGVASLLMQNVAEAHGNKDCSKVSELITSGLTIVVIIALFVFLVGIALGPYVIDWLNIRAEKELVQNAFTIAVTSSALMVVYYSISAINYALQCSMAIGIIYISATCFKIIMVLVLLRSGMGLLSLAYGELTSAAIMIISSLVLLTWNLRRNDVRYVASFKGSRQFFKLFMYTFMARLSKITTKNIDNVYISSFLGPESVVVYNLTNKVPATAENLVKLPVAAFRPALSHAFGAGDISTTRSVIIRLVRIVFWNTGVLTSGFLTFNDDFVRLWVAGNFFAGSMVNALICVVFLLNVWTNVVGMLLFSQGGIKAASLSDTASSLIVIPLMYVGVHFLGLPGLILAHIVTMLTTGCWYLPHTLFKKLHFLKGEAAELFKEFLMVASIGMLMFICFRVTVIAGWGGLLGYSSLMALSYTTLLTLFSRELRLEFRRLWVFFSSRIISR